MPNLRKISCHSCPKSISGSASWASRAVCECSTLARFSSVRRSSSTPARLASHSGDAGRKKWRETLRESANIKLTIVLLGNYLKIDVNQCYRGWIDANNHSMKSHCDVLCCHWPWAARRKASVSHSCMAITSRFPSKCTTSEIHIKLSIKTVISHPIPTPLAQFCIFNLTWETWENNFFCKTKKNVIVLPTLENEIMTEGN